MTRFLIGFLLLSAIGVLVWQFVHRTSLLVRQWHPSSFKRRALGPLSVLDGGPPAVISGSTVILLHGLGVTSDYFGGAYDGLARRHRVLIPDLLGFGGSLDEARTDFGLEAHCRALGQALDAADVSESRIVVVAHSMSASLALEFARVHGDHVVRVILLAPPVYRTEYAARSAAEHFRGFGRLLLLDQKWSRRLCRWNCAHRRLSGLLTAALAPRWPTAVSTNGFHHAWDAYHGSVNALALSVDWPSLFAVNSDVTVVRGAFDDFGDVVYVSELVPSNSRVMIPGADHHVPLSHPEALYELLGN